MIEHCIMAIIITALICMPILIIVLTFVLICILLNIIGIIDL
jgi:hypothetical protein